MRLFFREILAMSRTGLSINPTLWFLPCLFAIESVHYLLKKVLRDPAYVFTVVIMLSVFAFPSVTTTALPFSINEAAYNLVFYVIETGIKRIDMDGLIEKAICGVCFIFTLLLFAKPSVYTWAVQQFPQDNMGRYICTVCLSLVGIMGTIYLANLLKSCEMLKFWGRNSLIIFTTHIFFLRGMYYFLISLGLTVNQGYNIYSACTTASCLLIMIPVIHFFNDHLYMFIGKSAKK